LGLKVGQPPLPRGSEGVVDVCEFRELGCRVRACLEVRVPEIYVTGVNIHIYDVNIHIYDVNIHTYMYNIRAGC